MVLEWFCPKGLDLNEEKTKEEGFFFSAVTQAVKRFCREELLIYCHTCGPAGAADGRQQPNPDSAAV